MRWRVTLLWQALVPLLGALLAAARIASAPVPTVIDLGPTTALSAPVLLIDGARRTAIWRPDAPGALFAYADLSADAMARPLLPYPGPAPDVWRALPAPGAAFHLIWHARDGRVRSALLAPDGSTQRGPIDLTPLPATEFAVLPYRAGQALVLMHEAGGGSMTLSLIDAGGRPRRMGEVRLGTAERIAAGIDTEQTLHLAWLSRNGERGDTLRYAAMPVDAFVAGEPIEGPMLHRFDLDAAESVTSLALGLDATHAYVLVGITHGAHPDEEALTVASFPLAASGEVSVQPLTLPDPLLAWPGADPLNVGTGDAVALRWPAISQTPGAPLRVAVAARIADGWHPAVITFHEGAAVGTTLVPELAADASPAVAAVDGDGITWLAVGSLHRAEPHLTITASEPARLPDARSPGSVGLAARRGLRGWPLALTWLAASGLVLSAVGAQRKVALPSGAAIYWGGKHLLPPGLLTGGPVLLEAAGFRLVSSGVDALIALLATAMIAALGYHALAGRTRPLAACLVYGALDATLTWLVFGANVFA